MSDDNDNLRWEFADALAAAKRETKEDMRHENAAREKVQEKNMENVLTTLREMRTANQAMLDRFESRSKEALARLETRIEQRDKFMMVFIVVVVGVAVAVAEYVFGGGIPPAG